MFSTVEETNKWTGRTVTNEDLVRAQAIIEAYIGRVEADIDSASDKELLNKATAYQAVYMLDNAETIFTQMAVESVANFGSTLNFRDANDPFVAPLAKMNCKSLSWKKFRTVKTGRILGRRRSTWAYDWTHN